MMDFKKESTQGTGMSRIMIKPNLLGQSGSGMSFETKRNILNSLSDNAECTDPKNEV